MVCPQCSQNNADGVSYCVRCGRQLVAVLPNSASTTTPVQVPNYLVFAILSTVLCCLPAGIVAIVYAAQVDGKLLAGDVAGAWRSSRNAKLWCWIAAGVTVGLGLLYGLFVLALLLIGHRG